jgi:hypothetical protein
MENRKPKLKIKNGVGARVEIVNAERIESGVSDGVGLRPAPRTSMAEPTTPA